MDAAQKTEKISAPNNKHDDYCDSSAMGIHATLSMLPSQGTFASASVNRPTRAPRMERANHSGSPLFATTRRRNQLNKPSYTNL